MKLSYSSISSFNKCPFSFYSRYIVKQYKYEEHSDALKRGTAAHIYIENKLSPYKKGYLYEYSNKNENMDLTPYSDLINKIKPFIISFSSFSKNADAVFIELPLAIDKDKKSINFKDDNAFLVGIGDLFIIKRNVVYYFDWKTGKGDYPDDLQLDIMSYLFMMSEEAKYYKIDTIASSLVYIEQNKVFPKGDLYKVDNKNLNKVEKRIFNYIETINNSIENNEFITRKSPLCNYCNSLICPFSKNYDPLINTKQT